MPTVAVTVIRSNVIGQVASVPLDDPANPAAGRLPGGAPLYYNATTMGGDPSWPGVSMAIRPPISDQPNRTFVQVLLTADNAAGETYSLCDWEIYNLPQKAAGDVRGGSDPAMAVTAYQKPTRAQVVSGVRPGRRLLAVGVDPLNPTQYHPVPQYQDYPAPVFARVQGMRQYVDLPLPDPGETIEYIFDVNFPGVFASDPVHPDKVRIVVNAQGVPTVTTLAMFSGDPEPDPDESGDGETPPPPEDSGEDEPDEVAPVEDDDVTELIDGACDAAGIDDLRALAYDGEEFVSGEYVVAANGRHYHWTGEDWATGAAP